MIGPRGFNSAYACGLSFQARSSGVPGQVKEMPAREAMQVAKIRKMPMAVKARGGAVVGTATLYAGRGAQRLAGVDGSAKITLDNAYCGSILTYRCSR